MIKFFQPTFGQEEKDAISRVIDSGWTVQGKVTQEFEEKFADYIGAKYAVFVDSGTSALFLALKYRAMEWPRADTVQVPSLTFTSTAEIVVNAGFTPKFIDVNPATFCVEAVDPSLLAIPVHLTGVKSRAVSSIYDSAHRIEKNDCVGSTALWCYSFYATKNLSTVQGGMIATNDANAAVWLRAARDHGISKGTLERYTQKTPTYSIDFVGYRVKGDDLRAAIGLEQLKKLPEMTEARNRIVSRYNNNLGLPRVGNHLYPILVSDREKFFDAMTAADIQCSVHFLPLHRMPAYKKWAPQGFHDSIKGELVNPLANTEYLGARLVSLPLFPQMTDSQIDYVSENVLKTNLLIRE